MKFRREGQIFQVGNHDLPADCFAFAQSPQALVLEDRVRVYFSSRRQDGEKFLSEVLWVEFDKRFERTLGIASKPAIALGGLGAFDEHGVFPMNVVRDDERILAYTCGWSRRVSVSVETGIGFAESFDGGTSFVKTGDGPVMGPSADQPFLVGDPFVLKINGRFYMWYMFGTAWKQFDGSGVPERIYKIGQAVSDDGLNWRRHSGQVVSDRLHADESMALPTVIESQGLYHMIFCYRESDAFREDPSRGYRLGYASSEDLLHWERKDGALTWSGPAGAWESDMQCYPHLCRVEEQVYLLYNGNQFGREGFGLARLEAW